MENGKPSYDIDGPIDFEEKDCVPVEMKKGDLMVFNGRLLHKSDENLGMKSRYAYTWHTIHRNS